MHHSFQGLLRSQGASNKSQLMLGTGNEAYTVITFFHNEKDATAQGYAKKLSQKDLFHVTYLLMDVLPVITKLSLFFQRKDLDLPLRPAKAEG